MFLSKKKYFQFIVDFYGFFLVRRKATLREENVCERKFCGSAELQNFYIFAEKTFAVDLFETFLQIKSFALT